MLRQQRLNTAGRLIRRRSKSEPTRQKAGDAELAKERRRLFASVSANPAAEAEIPIRTVRVLRLSPDEKANGYRVGNVDKEGRHERQDDEGAAGAAPCTFETRSCSQWRSVKNK